MQQPNNNSSHPPLEAADSDLERLIDDLDDLEDFDELDDLDDLDDDDDLEFDEFESLDDFDFRDDLAATGGFSESTSPDEPPPE